MKQHFYTTDAKPNHTHHFNGHFSGKAGLADCPLDSQSPDIILSILIGQTFRSCLFCPQSILDYAPPTYINCLTRGLETEVFTGRMPFQPQCQSTEGRVHALLTVTKHG